MPDHKQQLCEHELKKSWPQAESTKDADAQRKMRGIATTYEKLAQGLERHACDVDEK